MKKGKVSIRLAKKNDAEELYTLIQKNVDHLTQNLDYKELVEKRLEDLKDEIEKPEDKEEIFVVILNSKIIGSISLIKHKEEIYGLGYWLGSDYLGKGYMTNALKEVVRYAIKEHKAKEIWAGIKEANSSSIKLVERLGFSLARKQPTHLSFVFKAELNKQD